MRNCFGPIILDAGASPASDYLVCPGPLYERVKQNHLQVAAMNGELRHVVTGETAGRLAVNELAETVIEAIFAGGDGHVRERLFKTERT